MFSDDSKDGLLASGAHGSSDLETTPRSEAPPSVNVMTPRTTDAATMANAEGNVNDYFTTQPAAGEIQQHQTPRSPRAPGSANVSTTSSDAATLDQPRDLAALKLPHLSLRPTPQHTPSSVSVESVDSTSTVRPRWPLSFP